MRRIHVSAAAALGLAALAAPAVASADEWIVAREQAPAGARASAAHARGAMPSTEVVRATRAQAARLERAPGVRYVEPNVRFRAGSLFDDPLLPDQWGLLEGGLDLERVWPRSTGAGVVVAVLDTGVDLGHPDLRDALWRNPGEVAGNGRDDDRNGHVDDVHGIDLANGDADPADDDGHGTHVAGIVAARAGNGVGGAGVAPSATIMPVKVLDHSRSGTAADLADGIRWAVAHGARVVNASLNGDQPSRTLEEAIREATAAGVAVVASAGNDGRDIDASPSYPAAHPDVLAVSASTPDGRLAPYSNRGPRTVDVSAPGDGILASARGGGAELRSGTSMAAPAAAGALALVAAVRPDLDGAALRRLAIETARPGPAAAEGGAGSLWPAGALDAAGARAADSAGSGSPQAFAPSASAGPRLRVLLRAVRVRRGRALLRWTWRGSDPRVARVVVTLDGRRVATLRPGRAQRVRVRVRAGHHRWRVAALDADGGRVTSRTVRFRVSRAAARGRQAQDRTGRSAGRGGREGRRVARD